MQSTLHIYIWCLFQIFIFLKLLSNTGIQGYGRKQNNTYDFPEDIQIMGGGKPSGPDSPALQRARNLWRNDLENLVPMNFLALAAAITQVNLLLFIVILSLFILFRIIHAVCMINQLQPFRTLSYLGGIGCMLVFAILIVIRLIPIFATF